MSVLDWALVAIAVLAVLFSVVKKRPFPERFEAPPKTVPLPHAVPGPYIDGHFFWDDLKLVVKFRFTSEFIEAPWVTLNVLAAVSSDVEPMAPRALRVGALEFMRTEHPLEFARFRTYFERCL